MESRFYLLLLLQIAVIAVLLLTARVSKKNPVAFFSPISWFILFYLLVFLLPQLYMPSLNYPLMWTDRRVLFGQLDKITLTQEVLCLFLACFTVSYFATIPPAAEKRRYQSLTYSDANFGIVFGVIGLIATLYIIVGLNVAGPRSDIVASTPGKIAYALTFWMTLGFLIYAAISLKQERYIVSLLLAGVFAVLLFQLGGRGRVLWPFVSLFAWAFIMGIVKLNITKVIVVGALLAVILQGMDPLLLYLRDRKSADAAWQEFQGGLSVDNFFFGRTFDSFHNLAVVVVQDKIEHRWSYLFSGSQEKFMREYFPDVARGGVGFPATLPGGLWIAGAKRGVVLGGLLFGLLFGWLARVYRNGMHRESDILIYLMAMPVVANIGSALLDSYLKTFALIFPGAVLILKNRFSE